MDTRPIGMFDSGCGGLTVLQEYKKTLPNEDIIYFGDTAHLPYGDKSKEKIIEYSEAITKFLINKNVKMIIIACGTASANSYSYLKENFQNIEIRNIIEPTSQNIKDKNIGVIATQATIKSNEWENTIIKYNPDANVKSIACPLFVPIIEEGFVNTPASSYIINKYLNKFDLNNIDSLILGCTHYPILSNEIQKVIGNSIKLINVGKYSATDTKEFLKTNNMCNDTNRTGSYEYYSSDDFKVFIEKAKKLGFKI